MKIAIVMNNFSTGIGGASAIAFDHAQLLKKRGHEVFVFTTSQDNSQEKSDFKIFFTKAVKPRYIFRSWLALRNLQVEKDFKNFLQEVKPEVVHFHNLYFELPFSLLKIAKNSKAKVFFTAHDVMTFSPVKLTHFVDQKYTLENIDQVNYHLPMITQIKQDGKAYNPLRNFGIRNYLKYVDKIFAVSAELKKALEQNNIINVEVIHNGIEIASWQADSSRVQSLAAEKNLQDKKIILFAGRLSGAKGGDVLLDIMPQIVAKVPEAVLLILGAGKNYEKKIAQVNPDLKNHIIFNGPVSRDKMKNYYALSRLAVVPSVCFDSFPTVNLEAMACHRPVVATIFGGGRELVIDNQTGYLVNPLNKQDLSEKIIKLLLDDEQFKNFGDKGVNLVENNFSQDAFIDKMLKFY